ncbi:ribokinase [Aerococcus urinaehominis]|uniref:Ribokinase n=1 Tax=Aerococcus urinaehominis TaxID=128944 RepID=A0A0X8FMU1_9LACT|nr:ribokinase [Aerococcus urinaehominis]AMB99562.1 ribokinase [Aerococcus urinaehominis]SDM35245.1 ribokinase [Aerococcus urinaehominis]
MIAVLGSISTDFVVTTNRLPQRGETVYGEDFSTLFGGKGANQAVAAARLGGQVAMFGCVGDDMFAQALLDNLVAHRIDVTSVETVAGQPSGSAHITLHEGDNAIIYVPGANQHVDTAYIDRVADKLFSHQLIVLQNEIPIETVKYVIELANQNDIDIVYDPAPSVAIGADYLAKVTYLTPNETELADLFSQGLDQACQDMPNQLIVTLGGDGLAYHNGQELVRMPALSSKVVDTTGAGDTFAGAFALALSQGQALHQALTFASLAASISVTKKGAQSGMPTEDELKAHPSYNN